MEKKTCKECDRYIQHYAFLDGRFRPVFCGHCPAHKTKKVKPYTEACDGFIPGRPMEEQLVTKEYLTKKMLEYFMKMELWEESAQ